MWVITRNSCNLLLQLDLKHFRWGIKPEVILKLNELPKTKTHPCSYIEKFHHIVSHYPEHLHVFRDCSKDHCRTTRAAVLNKIIHKKALPIERSISTAEVSAIDLALNIISRDKLNKFIIFFDSLSVLTSLENKKPLIVKLLSRLDSMSSHKKYFCVGFQATSEWAEMKDLTRQPNRP